MKNFIGTWLLIPALLFSANVMASNGTVEERQKEILDMRSTVLKQLFNDIPDAKVVLEGSWGYAIFSNTGLNLLMFSTARGAGVLRDFRDGSDTFMKAFGIGGGVGAGLKNYSSVIFFHTEAALDDFIEKGWELAGQAEANAKEDRIAVDANAEKAGALGKGVEIYQMTEAGFALQAVVQGFRFSADKELNDD
jgi:lipid-binding SYLF domain-containing protein